LKKEKIIVENGVIKKVKVKVAKEKRKLNYYEIVETLLYLITAILFITFYNGITEYKIFVWFVILSFLFSLLSNNFIMKLNKIDENNFKEKNDKIKK
jgi:Na+/H+ antiporter NhaC